MSHHCHATGCVVPVPPEMFMCRSHWFALPKALQERIWRTYRRGQEHDKQPSAAYCEAAKAAVTWIATREGREPDIRLYDVLAPAALES